MSEQNPKKKKRKEPAKEPIWPGGVSPKAAGCSYLELVQPLYDRFHEEAEKRDTKPKGEEKKPEKDDLPSPKAMGCGYLTLPDRPRR